MSKVISKKDWISNFSIIGVPKINDYTFKTDERSEKSAWIYNSLNLGIDCGETYGTVYCEMMGGYSEENPNVIYAHGKKSDGTDDFDAKIQVDWEDRFNPEILESIGDLSFITVGLEKTDKGKTFYNKFLSAYDAIAYIKEHLKEDTVINVRGNLKYSSYQDKVQVRKVITSIVLSKVENVSDYRANFNQTILINSDSTSMKEIDREKGVLYVNTVVLDYLKELNGVEIKTNYPYRKQFEYKFPNIENEKQCKAIVEKLFTAKRGYTQITFEGDLIEGGAVVTATIDDIPQDIKDLIAIGVYTEEEALKRCSSNGSREQRMVLRVPMTRLTGDEKIPVVQRFEERYKEEDFIFDFEKEVSDTEVERNETAESTSGSEDMAWLNNL